MAARRGVTTWVAGAGVVLGLLLAAPAWALDFGAFRVHPFLSLKEEFQSNVFQTARDEQDDFITTIIPGFAAEMRLPGRHSLKGGYRAEILRFSELDRQDTVHHIANLALGLDFPGGLLIDLREQFQRTSEPPNSELTGRIERNQNDLAAGVEYRLADRFSAGLDYTFTIVEFRDRELAILDRDEHLIGVTGFYRVQPKTALLLQYAHRVKNFDTATERGALSNLVLAGVRGELTAKVTTLFKIGWEGREPDQSGRRDFSGLVLSGNVAWQATPRTLLTLVADRSLQESSFAENDFFEATSGTLTLAQTVTPKLTVTASGTLGLNDYPNEATVGTVTKEREDTLIRVAAGLSYRIQRWLAVGADYAFTNRNSNFNDFDFDDHRVSAIVTFTF